MALLHDRITIEGQARVTPEGYFVADALVARANNIQVYSAGELGLSDRDPAETIRVYRPASEVFHADSLVTAARLPITLDHPVKAGKPVMVDASNWREFSHGQTDDRVMRDGEFMRIPLRVTDAQAVDSILSDRREFSLGYGAEIRLEPGVVADGEFAGQAYDAVAGGFRYNHLAACRAARGGTELRIVDERSAPPAQGAPKMPKIMTVDGLPVDVSDAGAAEATISKLLGDRATAQADATDAKAKLATAESTIVARDAEIVGLKDQVTNATPTPQALRDAAASFGRSVVIARALGATITDTMDEAAVRKAAVTHKMGDKAAAYAEAAVTVAFDTLAASLPANIATGPVHDGLRDIIVDGLGGGGDGMGERVKAHDARLNRFATAHQGAGNRNGAAAQ